MAEKLLEIENLTAGFLTQSGTVKATEKVSLSINKGQTVCLVGESGSGKSVTSLAIMRLIDYNSGAILEGSIKFQGDELAKRSQDDMIRVRGNKIAMIFQDPMSSLNPVYTIGDQIAESIMLHRKKSKKEARKIAVDMLRMVGIPAPEIRAKQYPHELSGGMCQRVVIAIALACDPDLLIADEPTTALDVTVQAQILDLLRGLQQELGMSILLITHDMGVAAEMADRIAVMYAGIIVEEGSARDVFARPSHPYTEGLLKSVPGLEGSRGEELYTIKGNIPGLSQLPEGCRFHPRCPHAKDICRQQAPPAFSVSEGHQASCWMYMDEGGAAAWKLESNPEVSR
ncbi:ABC transporter ATP-binding protein [Paenibacillus glycanilyticus]|uniref:Peptide ABC transporter ATP-binding protein n=1 Tax=Paenibacillus glycanilyticus TaxID=126569 RepID=A0ABQ6G4L3_9BACL|nr:ABC transporter ATP-binding protein [Paenibacillus glycanilyticus]GLX65896.1 peptide ABC transporter ATP-binding protein [Paenibacillus glycanilyticus]